MIHDALLAMRPSRLPPSLVGYEYVRELVRRNSAIVLDESKDYLIESRLAPLAIEAGIDGVSCFIEMLRSQNPGKWHGRVVEALTTNETSFFRDMHPFEVLAERVLPELIPLRAKQRKLRIWSAACSTGQEPYSIAITLLEKFPELASWDVEIFATDLNETVLERARAGVYKQLEVNRGLPAKHLVHYFRRAGADWRVKPDLSRLCSFQKVNLIGPWVGIGDFDIVFLRNVLIYFDVATKKDVLTRIRRVLGNDGFLFLGGGETTLNLNSNFDRAYDGVGGCFRVVGREN